MGSNQEILLDLILAQISKKDLNQNIALDCIIVMAFF